MHGLLLRAALRQLPTNLAEEQQVSIRLERYFGFPPEFYELDIHREVKGAATELYLYLWWRCDRRSSRELKLTECLHFREDWH